MTTKPIAGLDGHPGTDEIFILLCSGWSPLRVAILIGRKYGLPIRTADVEAYAAAIPEECKLGLPDISDKFSQVNGPILDVIGEMTHMLLLMRDRIDASKIIEDQNGKPDQRLAGMMKLYFSMLEKYANALKIFGLTEARSAPVPSARPEELTLREIIDGRGAISEVSPAPLHDEGVGEVRLLGETSNS